MASAIDETKPADGVPASKLDLRTNLATAKSEITAAQNEITAILAALQLVSGSSTFAPIAGTNFPLSAATLRAILQSLDAAIVAAAAGTGGGPITLASITDIQTPSDNIRRAFQNPIEVSAESADFAFDENAQGGSLVPLDSAANSVQVQLPAAGGLTREDGYLASFSPRSAANVCSIIAPAGTLRIQNGFFGITETQTEVFIGLSQASGFRAVVDVFKEGTIYIIRGPARLTSGEDISFGAPGSVPGSALAALGLTAAAFPNALDLGGTKQAGGSRDLLEQVAGVHTFLHVNAGKTIEHTGAGAATWVVPDLLDGTTIEVDNAAGGELTFNNTGGRTVFGGLTLSAGGAGAAKWLSGNRIRFVGTV